MFNRSIWSTDKLYILQNDLRVHSIQHTADNRYNDIWVPPNFFLYFLSYFAHHFIPVNSILVPYVYITYKYYMVQKSR